jgi:hypothetical protein
MVFGNLAGTMVSEILGADSFNGSPWVLPLVGLAWISYQSFGICNQQLALVVGQK